MWLAKLICKRVSLTCKTVNDGSARIAKSHHFRAFVDCLACCIVDGLTENLHVVICIHLNDLGVSAAYQKTNERQWRHGIVVVRLLYEVSHHMTLQMVYINERYLKRTGKSFGETNTHKKRPHQPWTSRECYCRELFFPNACTLQCLVNHRNNVLLMGTRCQLRNHSAVSLVYILRCCYIA